MGAMDAARGYNVKFLPAVTFANHIADKPKGGLGGATFDGRCPLSGACVVSVSCVCCGTARFVSKTTEIATEEDFRAFLDSGH